MIIPLVMAGISSPSARSTMIVPDTGELLKSSYWSFRDAFRLPGDAPDVDNLAFFVGVVVLEDDVEGLGNEDGAPPLPLCTSVVVLEQGELGAGRFRRGGDISA